MGKADYIIQVFVIRMTDAVSAVTRELKQMLEAERGVRAEVCVVNLLEHPEKAVEQDVYATPTIIKLSPGETVRVIGSLDDARYLMRALDKGRV